METITIMLLCVLGIFIRSVVANPYEQYILAPSSRILVPKSVYNVNGSVSVPEALTESIEGIATFQGASAVTYDFGKNIAGIVSFNTSAVTGEDEYIGISFTESSLWVNEDGCDATADAGIDQALWFSVESDTSYAADKKHQRGGFRYLNVYHNTTGTVEVQNLSIYFTALPQKAESDMRTYTGYFHCDDDQVNRVWYAGAYTNQMCTIDPTAGNSLIHLDTISSNDTITTPVTWWNNFTVANGSSVLVDGAKRDRLVWPGDIAISGPSIFVSTNDMDTIKNSLDAMLVLQNSSGALPYAGVPFSTEIPVWSFTYHLYSLIDVSDYYLYTGNITYLKSNWDKFKLGLNFIFQFIDDTGMANVTSSADWLRFGMGGHNIEANSILYYTLNQAIGLASVVNDTSNITSTWSTYAANIKSAANTYLWDPSANLYRDNDSLPLTSLHPQDGNSWAIISNLVSSPSRAINISSALASRWGPYGAPAPEAGATVSPFVSGFELQAHYLAGQGSLAIQLIKLMWASFMLDDPRMTNSTFIEGYSTNGDLHYAPYSNDPRISHAHGWATGPTSTLTFHAAGLQLTSAAGATWLLAPQLGGLKSISAGFQTSLGSYSVNITESVTTGDLSISLSTPPNTSGKISVPYPSSSSEGSLTLSKKKTKTKNKNNCSEYVKDDTVMTINLPAGGNGRVELDGLEGGEWAVKMTSN